MNLEPRNLLGWVQANVCPTCGGRKFGHQVICFVCWQKTPVLIRREVRAALDTWGQIGPGFAAAMERGHFKVALGLAPVAGQHCNECDGYGFVAGPNKSRVHCPSCVLAGATL